MRGKMSKIGRIPIEIKPDVKIEQTGNQITVTGPKGEFIFNMPNKIDVKQIDGKLLVSRKTEDKPTRALHGLWRVLLENAIVGVSTGWEKKMDFKGVGYKAEVQDNKLVLSLGFSHPVEVQAPEGISFSVVKNVITVSGSDKQKVGQIAADIRKLRPVEPYKGKGIKYIDEIPRRKLGKAAKAASA